MSKVFSLERYGVVVEPGYITFKSPRFKALLNKISERRRTFWRIISNLSVVFGAGLLIYVVYFLTDNLLKLIQPGVQGASILPVLPGLTIRLYWLPYLLLAISLGVIMHEAVHGVIARIENIPLESAGLAFVVVFPAGFVEPREKEFEASSSTSKLRVVSSGSFVNLLAFLLVILIMLALFVDAPSGIVVTEVLEGSPIDRAGLKRWDVIYSVNGTFPLNILANVTSGDVLILNTTRYDHPLRIDVGNSTGGKAVGILPPYLIYYPSKLGLGPLFDVQLWLTLFWGEIIQSSLAILNMLPLYPFDGDKFLFYAIKGLLKERSRMVRIALNSVFFAIIAGNMILSLIKSGPFLI